MKAKLLYLIITLFMLSVSCSNRNSPPSRHQNRLRSINRIIDELNINEVHFDTLMDELALLEFHEEIFYRIIIDKRLDILMMINSNDYGFDLPEKAFQFAFLNVTNKIESFEPVHEVILGDLIALGSNLNEYNESIGSCALSEAIFTANINAVRWIVNHPSFDPQALNNFSKQACLLALLKSPYLSLLKNPEGSQVPTDENFIIVARDILKILKLHKIDTSNMLGFHFDLIYGLADAEREKVNPLINLIEEIWHQ